MKGSRCRQAALLAAGLALGLPLFSRAAPPAGAAASHAEVEGSGSSWAYNAVAQWISDTNNQGLQVVFTSTGSAQGRQDFGSTTSDFGVSDIPYQGVDQLTGNIDRTNRPYAYLPIVSGGTAFPYQIRVGNELVRNLRLSGETLAKIFTNQITNWEDPQITSDNNGQALPSLPIVPVIHSEGSGSTAQFTTFLDTQYPQIWRPFAGAAASIPAGKAFTEYFPAKGNDVPENGSDGVMNFIAARGSNGAIGFDEYSYALGKSYPVAKIENAAHYFTLPNQYNVAVALTQAKIDTVDVNDPTRYLTQDLTDVYSYSQPPTYPLSSYSYGIIPTSPSDPRMTTPKRQTLVDYLYYSICGGQQEVGKIGYSSLPLNLVQASFSQIDKLKDADPNVDISARDPTTCNNPTFDPKNPGTNLLAEQAPTPPDCDKRGAGPCDASGNAPSASASQAAAAIGGTTGGTTSGTAAAGAKGSGAKATGGEPSAPGSSSGPAGGTPGAGAVPATSGDASPSVITLADGAPVQAASSPPGDSSWFAPLAGLLALAILAGPPVLVMTLRQRRQGDPR